MKLVLTYALKFVLLALALFGCVFICMMVVGCTLLEPGPQCKGEAINVNGVLEACRYVS